jgi:hypothetical protein
VTEDQVATCWWCGIEPDETYELRSLAGTVRLIHHWPASDHTHRVDPPTPDEMFDAVMLRPSEEP